MVQFEIFPLPLISSDLLWGSCLIASALAISTPSRDVLPEGGWGSIPMSLAPLCTLHAQMNWSNPHLLHISLSPPQPTPRRLRRLPYMAPGMLLCLSVIHPQPTFTVLLQTIDDMVMQYFSLGKMTNHYIYS